MTVQQLIQVLGSSVPAVTQVCAEMLDHNDVSYTQPVEAVRVEFGQDGVARVVLVVR